MVLLMLKLDGLTIKLTYEKGRLLEAATRGDGETGENVLRNVPFIKGIPVTIPYQKRLVLSGEAFIRQDDFKRLQEVLRDENGEAPKNGRNLASGSVQSSNPKHCQGRCVRFMPFNVLEGLEEIREEGRGKCLSVLEHMGFSVCPYIYLEPERSNEETELWVQHLKTAAERKNIPIDGIVAYIALLLLLFSLQFHLTLLLYCSLQYKYLLSLQYQCLLVKLVLVYNIFQLLVDFLFLLPFAW